MNEKAAIYCRLSEEDRNKVNPEDDSLSIQNQKSMLIKYAISHGWEVYNIYSDDDYTGSDRNRPMFQKLLHDAEEHKFDIVLCKSQSRFTREIELVEKYIHTLFPIWGIRFVGMVDNADTNNPGNKKSRQINAMVNEWYLEDMSESIKGALTSRREDGYFIGAFAPYGYEKDPDLKGHLIIDEEAAETVREVFRLFLAGYGKIAIARILNERGIPNPTEYKRRKGLRYRGPKTKNSTLWSYFAIADMLINEVYIGNMIQGKYENVSYKSKKSRPVPKERWIRKENTHEAIIDKETWDSVQKIIGQRSKPFGWDGVTVRLFARKTRCMNCGYTMISHKSVRGYYYLQCATKHKKKDACIGAFIAQRLLEEKILNELHVMIDRYLNISEAESMLELEEHNGKILKDLKTDIISLEKELEEADSYFLNLYKDKAKGTISEEEFNALALGLREEKEKNEKMLQIRRSEMEVFEQQKENVVDRRALLEKYTNITKLDREIVETLIDYIEIGRKDAETGEIPIIIHWNF